MPWEPGVTMWQPGPSNEEPLSKEEQSRAEVGATAETSSLPQGDCGSPLLAPVAIDDGSATWRSGTCKGDMVMNNW